MSLVAGIAAVFAVAAIGGAYYAGLNAGRDNCQAGVEREDRMVAAAGDKAASAAAEAIKQIKVSNVTIRQKLETEIRERTVFRDCRSGPTAVGLYNSAIPGAAASQPAAARSELPASGAAR